MEYKQLIEMPRFHIDYSITFLNKMYKEQISAMIEKANTNDDCILSIQCDEYESFVLNLQFSRFLFCGFSCSDAIEYLFPNDLLEIIESIISKYENNIEDISLSIECYENKMAKYTYMNTDIVGNAAKILHKLKPDVYFTIGVDGVYSLRQLKEVCGYYLDLNLYEQKSWENLLFILKNEYKKLLKNKNENFKKIIMVKYAIIYVKRLIKKNVDFMIINTYKFFK